MKTYQITLTVDDTDLPPRLLAAVDPLDALRLAGPPEVDPETEWTEIGGLWVAGKTRATVEDLGPVER